MDGNKAKKRTTGLVFLFIVVLLLVACVWGLKQKNEAENQKEQEISRKMLVGTWEYEKGIDENGNEIEDDLSNTFFSVNEEGTAKLSFGGVITVDCRWEYTHRSQEGRYYQIQVIGNSVSGEREENEKNLINEAEIVSEENGELAGRLCFTNADLPGVMLVFKKTSEQPTELVSITEAVDDFVDDIGSMMNGDEDEDRQATIGEQNALEKAYDYLSTMAFSYKGLIEQLEFEGFSNSEATYAADHCGADWDVQAARKAREYLNIMSLSRSDLIDQLEFEGFTASQAAYGASENGL